VETVLLAWNPSRFPWGSLEDELTQLRKDGSVTRSWSVGNRTTLAAGSRFFLIRLGVEPRGLVGAGWITSEPFEDLHWDQDRANRGETTRYAEIYFDYLSETPLVGIEQLKSPPFSNVNWSTQVSGIEIEEPVAADLEKLWAERTNGGSPTGLEEISTVEPTIVNHSSRVYVNRYERSPRARALCLAHHGNRCSACQITLSEKYGRGAEHIVHVHHLVPLSEIPKGYEIDPINDLRPVCPNCHAVIHSRTPPYTIEELRKMIAEVEQSANHAMESDA